MLWVKVNDLDATYQVASYNVHRNNKQGTWELWITRPNDKPIAIVTSGNELFVKEVKAMFDDAIEKSILLVEV